MVLGIESSAHTLGVGIVDKGKILANEKSMYNIATKGMIPGEVADFHIEHISEVISNALHTANISIDDLQGICYTKGPGIGPCLQVGQLAAKTIASETGLEITPVNHSVAHIEIARHFAKQKDPLVLYVSGGNSQILKLCSAKPKRYCVLGETFDIGVGNMLDNFARAAKLNPAWGSTVAKHAKDGKYIDLPYTVKGMDFAFTGLLTKASSLLGREKTQDICFSIQENAFSMLCEATERALLMTNSNELCVCGGVAQSSMLKDMLKSVAEEHSAKFGYAPDQYNADNGAMIAFVGERILSRGQNIKLSECNIDQKFRTDLAIVY